MFASSVRTFGLKTALLALFRNGFRPKSMLNPTYWFVFTTTFCPLAKS